MKRNGKIELMRFVFAVIVLIFHINQTIWSNTKLLIPDSTWSLFKHGNMGVEFFFLVSGYLMARSIYKYEEKKSITPPPGNLQAVPIGDETLSFLWNKIKAILPFHIVFNIAAIFVIIFRSDISNTGVYLLKRIPGFFFLGRTGLYDSAQYIGEEWYISAMLLMMAIIYPIARRYYASYTHMFGPLASLFILGYLYMEHGMLGGVTDWNGFTYYVVLRAFAELTLGMTCFEISRKMQSRQFTRRQRLAISAGELLCYGCAIRYMCSTSSIVFDFLCFFALCVAITLSFSNQGLLANSRLFQNKLCLTLGALSLPIYLAQRPAINFVYYFLSLPSNRTVALLMLALTLGAGVLSYFLVQAWKKHAKKKLPVS